MRTLTTPIRGLISAIVIVLAVGIGTAVARSGDTSSRPSSGAAPTTASTASVTSAVTDTTPATTATSTTATTAAGATTVTTTGTTGGTTATTAAPDGSGLGTGGTGQVAMGESPRTGGTPWTGLAAVLLVAAAVIRRISATARPHSRQS